VGEDGEGGGIDRQDFVARTVAVIAAVASSRRPKSVIG